MRMRSLLPGSDLVTPHPEVEDDHGVITFAA